MRVLLFFLMGAVSNFGHADFNHFRTPDVDFRLSNGLRVVGFEDNRIPLISLEVVFPFGHRHDPMGKAGLVSLLSSVLKRGYGGRSASEVARALEIYGSAIGVGASEDQTSISVQGLSRDWRPLLKELAAAVLSPNFEEKEVLFVKDLVMGSIRHIAERPSSIAGALLNRQLFLDTPYNRGTIERLREMKKISVESVRAFYQEHFVPNGATLVVVGKLDASIKREVEGVFGKWTSETVGAAGPRPSPYLRRDVKKSIFVTREGLTQAQVMMGIRVPPIRHEDRTALVLANVILGRMFTSRLMSKIRDELGWTYSIGSQFVDEGYHSSLQIMASTRNQQVGPLISKMNEIVSSMWRSPPSKEEVENALSFILGSAPIQFSSVAAFAQSWLNYEYLGYPQTEAESIYAKFKAVTPEQVKSVIERHLKGRVWTYAVAGSQDEVKLNFKDWEVIDARKWTQGL